MSEVWMQTVQKGKAIKGCGRGRGKAARSFFAAVMGCAMLKFCFLFFAVFGVDKEVHEVVLNPNKVAMVSGAAYFATGDYPMAVPDSGCTSSIAGLEWLKAAVENISHYGLRPIIEEHKEVFHGLGGAKRVAERRWSFPAGIQHNHFITSFAEIEGSTVGLISRFELAKLGYTCHAMEDACSFSKLGVEWLPFAKKGRKFAT